MNVEKENLRREIRLRLQKISPATRAEFSLVICQIAANLPSFRQSQCVALYAPLASEPDIHPLIEEAWALRKRVALPLMLERGSKPDLAWHEVSNWEDVVVPGPFGLREPEPLRCPRVQLAELDCVFVPGLAFDQTGFRLGRGGGFYDSFLSQVRPNFLSVGLFFATQKVDRVPREAHDQPLQNIITEDGLQF